MSTASQVKQSLSAEDWAEAALDVIAEGGLDQVAVEPLARRLGVTKGSFYWHFANRETLLRHALNRWEQQQYDVALDLTPEMSTTERLFALLRRIANTDTRSERVLMALAASDHPLAREATRQVSRRWRELARQCYVEAGSDPDEADHWAAFVYSTYIGVLHLRKDEPETLPAGSEFSGFIRFVIRSLLPRGLGPAAEGWRSPDA